MKNASSRIANDYIKNIFELYIHCNSWNLFLLLGCRLEFSQKAEVRHYFWLNKTHFVALWMTQTIICWIGPFQNPMMNGKLISFTELFIAPCITWRVYFKLNLNSHKANEWKFVVCTQHSAWQNTRIQINVVLTTLIWTMINKMAKWLKPWELKRKHSKLTLLNPYLLKNRCYFIRNTKHSLWATMTENVRNFKFIQYQLLFLIVSNKYFGNNIIEKEQGLRVLYIRQSSENC